MRNSNKSANKVKADYNKISAQFASTRHYQWSEMKEFSAYVKNGWRVLDAGCGNGRLLTSLEGKKIDYLGIDSSENLIKLAQKEHPKEEFLVMNMDGLKLKESSYDAAFAIASLHHLPSRDLRLQALSEIDRVLKDEGYFFITVWNLWQKKYRKYIWRNLSNIIFKKEKAHFGDTFIPWKDSGGNVLAERYYFAYTKKGLEKDLRKTGFQILKLESSGRNFYAICKKCKN